MSEPLFSRYMAVDWSAANTPNTGKDSVWIALAGRDGSGAVVVSETLNPPTREAAMARIRQAARDAIEAGERLVCGFDFPFGYPRGGAAAITGAPGWEALWAHFHDAVHDRDDYNNNRFEVAGRVNRDRFSRAPMFWGRPNHLDIPGLSITKPAVEEESLPEKRACETRTPKAQPVWKLAYAGSVGGQALLGMARLEAMRRDEEFAGRIAVWPFETGFADDLAHDVILTEIYPGLVAIDAEEGSVTDERQVKAVARAMAERDAEGRLAAALAAPDDLDATDREACLREEGWIVGLGGTLEAPVRPTGAGAGETSGSGSAATSVGYLRDPRAIYAESFRLIRAEADLSSFAHDAEPIAVRMIHACGMPDLAEDLAISEGAAAAGRTALRAGAPVLCDAAMVAFGITAAKLPAGNRVVCRLNEPQVPVIAAREGTTRSAAQVALWMEDLEGAVVAIGNAPTALYRLLEAIDAGAGKPALIVATPVGFVGAAESKAELAANARDIPFITVQGRRGGSAMAAAAVNALAADEEGGG